MGLRFGKRITIIPGVRLNISKSGVSASVGPRGLSLTASRRGVHLNAGTPGTGLSYRERLDRPNGSRRTTGATSAFSGPVSISVDDTGALSFTDSAGAQVPPAVVKRIKAERVADIEALLHRAAEKTNRDLEACLGVHLLTPAPDQMPKGLPDFAEPAPQAPQHSGAHPPGPAAAGRENRRDFVALCFGLIFRVTGEAFAALPTIQRCVVSGYIQRPNPATGSIRDDYIISAVIERSDWMRIDFNNLENVDPTLALKALDAWCKLARSARFVPIEPFEMAVSGQVTAYSHSALPDDRETFAA